MSSTGAGYDLSVNTYSPDGRIFQLEYSNKAVESAGCAIGLKCKDGVVLGVEKIIKSKLLTEGSNRRIFGTSLHCGIAFSGWDADGVPVAKVAREECEGYKENFGIDIPPSVLADRLGHYMHAYTCYGGYRPYGIALLILGFDEHDKQAYLHVVETSGVQFRYRGCSIGKGRQTVKTELEKLDLENLTCRQGLKEIARIIRVVQNDDDREKSFEFEASWVCQESNWKYQQIPKSIRDEADTWAKQKIEE